MMSIWPSLLVCISTIAGCWLLSVFTREYSWTDRLWSIAPAIYGWIYAWQADFQPRALLGAALMTAWAVRLTLNFWRKGGFAPGGEDYRWAVLRSKMPPWAWEIFNLAFVAFYQNALVWAITLPAWRAAFSAAPLGPLDLAVAGLFLAALAGETVADQQQWDFHAAKRVRVARGEAGPDFCTTGLFAWSRHPNFFFEQIQWWVLTLLPVAAGAAWLDPTILGAVLLTLLFEGSTRFTESISAGKYPAYAEYQRTTSRLLPLPPRRATEPAQTEGSAAESQG